jgi:hypothetical protein
MICHGLKPDELVEEPSMAQVEKLLIFLASPGDVPNERRYVREAVEQLNRTVAPQKGIVLQVVSWENDTFPGYGMDAQALINTQIAEMAKHSLFVGIMWNRIGTLTPRAASGTVEEFERAVAALAQHGQPDIWFYFREAAAKLDTDEQLEQRKRVLEFRKRVQANGLPWSYKRPSDIRDKFLNQMILWLTSPNREAAATQSGPEAQLQDARPARLAPGLMTALTLSRDSCAARNVPFRTPCLLLALLQMPRSFADYCFDQVEHGLGRRVRALLETYVRDRLPLEEVGSSFVPFEWDEREDVRFAQRCAVRDGAAEVGEKHLLLGVLQSSSLTVQQLKAFLRQARYDQLFHVIRRTPADLEGTSGEVFPQGSD